jgi:hypothetical protein
MAPHEVVDEDMPNETDSSMDEADRPMASEALSLAEEILKDRKRLRMARGGMVDSDSGSSSKAGALQQTIDAPDEEYLDNVKDELAATMEDGRDSRGLNAGQVHTMSDDEHDESDASLVAEILRDRKMRRRG